LEQLRKFNSDLRVMRHVTGRPASFAETDAEWTGRLRERSDHQRGLGYWIGRTAERDEFVGWWGLGSCSWDLTTGNLGFRLMARHWGQGIATEGGCAVLGHAIHTAHLRSIWASTSFRNAASQRVLTKLGLTYVGVRFGQAQFRLDFDGKPAIVAEVS
jgi:RimJ/RimL family protein N-acetyltransferase